MLDDETYLAHAIRLSEQAAAQGRRPFGALVVRSDGVVVAEAGATATAERRDWTQHAEMAALRQASALLEWNALAECTLYASAEPCPMCASAVYWCNLRRVVFSVSAASIDALRRPYERAGGIAMSAHEIFARCPREIELVGPLLNDLGIRPHLSFWRNAPPEA